MSLQPGTINAVIAAEVGSVIAEALSAQLIVERDEALGRQDYERVTGSPSRNGFKLVDLPGLFGRMILRRPVLSPLRRWRRGTSTL